MKQKRILDSVHGNIYVDEIYFSHLIDTPEFQRLRRIEQTSIRSIFPSARHDRFIHSIGVYHIGTLFTSQLHNDAAENDWFGITEAKYSQIVESYHIACLLHDIAHAPFSHTFEEYYGRKTTLKNQLKQSFEKQSSELQSSKKQSSEVQSSKKQSSEVQCPISDVDLENEANYHEYASAILVLHKFREQIKELGADEELVIRMIIGCSYSEDNEVLKQIKNCFISLLNGGIIDADRLDYACRDVWASGYSTSNIDVSRLVSGTHIAMNKDGKYYVCFNINVLNEIKGVLDVKDFQTKYVIHHHTVVYEQYMLVKAAEQMALEMLTDEVLEPLKRKVEENVEKTAQKMLSVSQLESLQKVKETNPSASAVDMLSIEKREQLKSQESVSTLALEQIISLKSLTENKDESIILKNGDKISYLTDDDLVYLMKHSKTNTFYKQWSSRQYQMFALWKTPDEFYHYFPDVVSKKISKNLNDHQDKLYKVLKENGLESCIVKLEKYKPRVSIGKLKILMGDDIIEYSKISTEKDKSQEEEKPFFYIFIPKSYISNYNNVKIRKAKKLALIKKLKTTILSMYNVQKKKVNKR